jgi:hypothetical protein
MDNHPVRAPLGPEVQARKRDLGEDAKRCPRRVYVDNALRVDPMLDQSELELVGRATPRDRRACHG